MVLVDRGVGGLVGCLGVLIDFRPDYVINDRHKADPYSTYFASLFMDLFLK
jgi:hypothetical protein